MQGLNRNNFLRWKGQFTKSPYSFSTFSSTYTLYANQNFAIVQPMASITASLGLDLNSFNVTEIRNQSGIDITLSEDLQYDGSGNLTVPRPTSLSVTQIQISFTVADNSGNLTYSLVIINVSAIMVAWVSYPTSYVCIVDSFGNQTGSKMWTQLVLINASTLANISPLTLKDNIQTDPDYISPVQDLITCPSEYVGSAGYAPLRITNASQNQLDGNLNDYIQITNIFLYNATAGPGSTPVSINIPIPNTAGIFAVPPPPSTSQAPLPQTFTFNIPAGIVWALTIDYTVHSGGNMSTANPTRTWNSNTNGVIAFIANVINTSPLSGVNITLGFPLGLTIFAQ